MDEEKLKTICILNRNYPPISGITGESAKDLAKFLDSEGFNIKIVTTNGIYNNKNVDDARNFEKEIFRIKTIYNGKNKILRLFANLYEGFLMTYRAHNIKADYYICMTDPPLLPLFASLFLKNKWILWSMDIYPDAFISAKLVKPTNLIVKWIYKILTSSPPVFLIALGEIQNEFLKEKYYPQINSVILPCGIYKYASPKEIPEWITDNKIKLGYCGNIGDAHSTIFLKEVIENLNPEYHLLILSVYGSKASEILTYALNRDGIKIVDHVSREQLQFIDIHLSSLLDEWVNVCVPSKSVSAICSGKSFLYCGKEKSDNWNMFSNAGFLVRPSSVSQDTKSFFSNLNKALISTKVEESIKLRKRLYAIKSEAYQKISSLLN